MSQVTAEVLARRGFTDAEAARGFLHPDHRLHSPYLLEWHGGGSSAYRPRPSAGRADRRARRLRRRRHNGHVRGRRGPAEPGRRCPLAAAQPLQRRLRHRGRRRRGAGGRRRAPARHRRLRRQLRSTRCVLAQKLGIDVIVTDHHELAGELPPCIVVSPKLAGYSFSGPGRRRRRFQARSRAGAGPAERIAWSCRSPCVPWSTSSPWARWPTSCRCRTRTAPWSPWASGGCAVRRARVWRR